jgi:hypothetical protein
MSSKGVKVLIPLKRINEVIAKKAGCSVFQVHKIETVLTKAPEQLKQKALDGKVKVDNAYTLNRKTSTNTGMESTYYLSFIDGCTEDGIQ